VISHSIQQRACWWADHAQFDQSITTRFASLLLSLLVGFVLGIGCLIDAHGQAIDTTEDKLGVRHSIIANLELDPAVLTEESSLEPLKASVLVSVRILDYARDSRFYGVVNINFFEVNPSMGPAAQEVWADSKCHQNRGLPHIWVLAIDGKIAQGKTISNISARPRHIGVWLPNDEIVMQKDPKMDLSDPNQSLVLRAKTTQSRIGIKLTLNSTRCYRKEN
jgi:hypothetical protein